mmetsp:Transcript_63385/g.182461  ORF Transcript_63385/g.182461 Transcript_63385/m.182461 type:complete len:760 (+) Transcript_63385:54-2333(+)
MSPPTVPPPPPATEAAGGDRALTIEEAEAELAVAGERERALELQLEKLYTKASHLCQSESRNLADAAEQHKQVPLAIRKLQETLSQTAGVADELSGRVRRLDAVCGRVGEALKLVDDMLELRECSDHVMKAIATEDFERAARYVARFRASQDALPPGTDDASVRVLCEAEQKLGAAVRERFEAAIVAKDQASVSRFAKLFHPLGLAREGVDRYTEFIRRALAERCAAEFRALVPTSGAKRADAEPMPYAQALTSAFMEVADIVQEHQQSVEEEFGSQNFIVVMRGMVDEADTQALKVIEKFAKDHAKVFRQQADADIQDVGATLEETALITQRTQQFHSYVHNVAASVVEMIADKEAWKTTLPEDCRDDDGLMKETRLARRVQELVNEYVKVENSFLQKSVEKAVRETDTLDPSDVFQLTTTLVDDVFFILHESLRRATSTFEVQAVGAILNCVSDAIGDQLKVALQGNLSKSKGSYNNWASHAENIVAPPRGKHPLESLFFDTQGKPRVEFTAAASWPHSLNNLQQCLENIDMLKASTMEAFEETFPHDGPDKDKLPMLHNLLAMALDDKKAEFEALHVAYCKEGVTMFIGHLKPSLDPLGKLDYIIDEDRYADFQVNDPFAKAFNSQTEVVYQHVKAVFNPVSCEEIMQELAVRIVKRMEKEALSKRFSLLGALQFESDVRILCSFFTNVSEQALRHKFARLFEMSSLLSLESVDELQELLGDVRESRLTPDEIRKLLASRVDLDASEAELSRLLPS